jgi:ABC-type dipeptide/oligopeptide/nickel transport system permease subunit
MTISQTPSLAAAPATTGTARRLRNFLRRNDLALVGGLFFAVVIFCSVAAPLLTPYDPVKVDGQSLRLPPSLAHPFGTDDMGRDVLARTLYGGRTILSISLSAVGVALVLGVAVGLVAGYWRGRLDGIAMRIMDVMLSFPSVLLAILIVAGLGRGPANAVIAISFFMIPVFARLARALVLALVNEDYVLAARALGASDWEIIRHHLLPNLIPPLIVQASAMLAIAISTSTALNFLGLGVQRPTPDWGLMVAEGQELIFDAPHVPFFPGLVITLTVVAVNFIGDGLRDRLDPKLRRL